jgi:E3 ubiquitin-protein ligase RHA2
MLMKYFTLVYTHLKWVLDFLLFYPFYNLYDPHMPDIGEELSRLHDESTLDSEEYVDCAVCLRKIGKGEVTRVLRCEHVFHKDCIDQWVSLINPTCPLCRKPVGPRRIISEFGVEVLFFEFCSVHANDANDTWWLR